MPNEDIRVLRPRKSPVDENTTPGDSTPGSGDTTSGSTKTWSNGTSEEVVTSGLNTTVISQGLQPPANQITVVTNAHTAPASASAATASNNISAPPPASHPAPRLDLCDHHSENGTVRDGQTIASSNLAILMAELEVRNAELEQAQRASAAARSRLEIARIEASQTSVTMAPPPRHIEESRVSGWVAQQSMRAQQLPLAIEGQRTAPRAVEEPSAFNNRDFELLSNRVVDAVSRNRIAPTVQRHTPELPSFDGSIAEWIGFRAEFEDTAPMFSDVTNVSRLRRALRGEARTAVKAIMYTVTNPYEIIDALERHFGDPEEIVLTEMHNVKKMPRLADDNSNITTFAGQVANVVATIRSLKQEEYLYAPELVNKIADKLNMIVRYEWNKYRASNKTLPGLVAISQFLTEISSASRKSHTKKPRASVNFSREYSTPHSTSRSRGAGERQYTGHHPSRSHPYDNYSTDSDSDIDCYQTRTVAQVNNKFNEKRKSNNNAHIKKKPAQTSAPKQSTQTSPATAVKCILCSGEHLLSSCGDFIKLHITKRWEVAKSNKLCYRCLNASHRRPNKCKYVPCGENQCEAGHHRLLHGLIGKAGPAHGNVSSINHLHQSSTYLKIVPVELTGSLGSVSTYALLDDGSSLTLIEREIADQIAPRGTPEPLSIEGVGGNNIRDPDSCEIRISVRGACSRNIEKMTAYTIEKLNLSTQSVSRDIISQCEHLRDIEDELCYDHAVPTVLVGQDNWDLIVSKQIRSGNKNLPVASLTSLGWVCHGKYDSPRKTAFAINHLKVASPEEDALALMKQHFSIESLGVENRVPKADPDQRAIDILDATFQRNAEGDRYEAGLLWRSDEETLPSNKGNALKRLHNLEAKLDKDENLKSEYTKQINNLLSKGYAEIAPLPAPIESPRLNYLPHFATFHAQKKKMRLVFDAASRTQGKCLNDALLTGPDLLQSLFGVLLRFRQGRTAVICDVSEMFLQIGIPEADRDSLRFLWREGDRASPPIEYRMKRLIFGSASSPATALYVKEKNAEIYREQYPKAADITINNSYMDDFLIALDEPDDLARQIVNEVYELNKKAAFELRSFASNRPAVIRDVTDTKNKDSSILGKSDSERTLGLIWNHARDTIGFNVNLRSTPADVLNGTKLPTKRQVTSSAMSIYDPLGYIAPISVIGKSLIQDIWRTGIGWDDTIANESVPMWNSFINNLQLLKELEIDRYVPAADRKGELHVFCDASEKVYATAIYFVSSDSHGNKTSRLVAAKARVAPLKTISIPRLELQSCVLGCRLAKTVREQSNYIIEKTHYWSDSRVTLLWIKSGARSYKSFVAHRIAEIEDTTMPTQWRWVPSALNVADDATKGVPPNFNNKHRWFFGPQFIRDNIDTWPVDKSAPEPLTLTGEERSNKPVCIVNKTKENFTYLPDVNRFSSFTRLIRSTSAVLLAAEVFKAKLLKRATTRVIGNDHLKMAELLHIKKSQQETFADEMKMLKDGRAIPKSSSLSKLAVKISDKGLLLLDGRIDRDQNTPVLHAKSAFTRLLIAHYHAIFNHANHATVMNELNQRYHIIGLRGSMRYICNKCQWCRIHKGKPHKVPLGDLPVERLQVNQPAFTATGCDLFGPMIITLGRRREKRWGVLYTCLTTRSIHIEMTASLSSSSLIMSLRRFMARRGRPTVIYSDNGTNLVGAEREIATAYDTLNDEVKIYAMRRKIIWKKIPPGNPSAGGAWERLIGLVKSALRATLKEKTPQEEVLHTLLLEAEHIVNSRPLTPVTLADGREALTPNHFLLGRSCAMSPFGSFQDVIPTPTSWKNSQKLADSFWKRWTEEYRPTLRARNASSSDVKRDIKVGDIVIIVDSTMPRGVWPKGEVIKTYPGPDGRVRVTEVRTAAGFVRRPTSRLIAIS